MTMRYLAIDLGQKRTGVACGDDRTRIVTPIEVIQTQNQEQRLTRIGHLLEKQMQVDALVVGLPLHMDGSQGPAANHAQAFAQTLRQRFALPVYLADERQSSQAANEQLANTGLTRGQKKARRDALAAARILERFLIST